MIKVDTTTLADIVNQCFGCATDGRFTPAQQQGFLTEGKRLRGLLMNLLSAQFSDGTQAVLDANTQLDQVNTRLTDSITVLAHVSQVMADVANLVGNLDKLLGIATGFL